MKAYFEEENQIKRDEIAARQLHELKEFQGPQEKKLRLADVSEMFQQMKDHGRRSSQRLAVPDLTFGARVNLNANIALRALGTPIG